MTTMNIKGFKETPASLKYYKPSPKSKLVIKPKGTFATGVYSVHDVNLDGSADSVMGTTYSKQIAQQWIDAVNAKFGQRTENVKLTPSQVKLKNVLRPIVEGILKEEDGDFDQTEIQLARKLGTKLASELDYDGTLVGLAFLVALTDSNFHEERTKLVPLLSKVLGAKYKTSG